MLMHLLGKKRLIVVGLNSGTSADAVDAAAVMIERRSSGPRLSYLGAMSRPLKPEVRRCIHGLADSEQTSLEEVVCLDQVLGRAFGQTARHLMRRLSAKGRHVDLIASHGQTVRHRPEVVVCCGQKVRGTLQLGNLSQIAAATGRVTIGDFRQADIAAGGEGAPITAGAMQRLFGDRSESRLIVNIGGMSNYFYLPGVSARRVPRAADCGPGNCLSDILAQRLFGRRFDRDGRLARRGQLSRRLLTVLSAEPFFSGPMQSTGREEFGAALAQDCQRTARRLRLSEYDLMRTVAELTVTSIVRAVAPLIRQDRRIMKLYLTGGGRRNRFMVARLREQLGSVAIAVIDELGIDGDFVEAAAFAVMGEAALRSEALPTYGLRRDRRGGAVLGQVAQPPKQTGARIGRH